jgi:two-component system, chemotaxis family, sensor kinase Cph1
VIAEDKADVMVGYLGHRFPASDIPAQARALYTQNPIRCIPDVNYTPAPIAVDRRRKLLDLSFSILRSVSPIHLEYLRNMAVQASMSISVLQEERRLWGLVACHHATPRFLPYEVRQACELLGQVFAAHVQALEHANVHERLGEFRRVADNLVRETAAGRTLEEALARHDTALLGIIDAGGMALLSEEGSLSMGEAPAAQELAKLADWLRHHVNADCYETDRLPSVYAPASGFATAETGLLAMAMSPARERYLLWFRPELVHTVRWGGRKDKPAYLEAGTGRDQLHPRKSFETWVEEVRGRSAPWERRHLAVAHAIKDLVTDVLLRQAAERDRLTRQLARSNDQLETFVYTTAHDLRSPLTYLAGYAELLQTRVPPGDPAGIAQPLTKMMEAAERMKAMLEDLTEFAKVTKEGEAFRPMSLDDVLTDVLTAVQPDLVAAGAAVQREPLPMALGDPAQIRHVFQNLVLNAVKYRDPQRALVIRVGVPARGGDTPVRRNQVGVFVADNGIGFEMKDRDWIFQPFRQLEPGRKKGSGMGLAICRRIVLRHGGEIEAFGAPGEGAVLRFSLPAVPAATPPDAEAQDQRSGPVARGRS